jgi:type II secretory pathway component PulJ
MWPFAAIAPSTALYLACVIIIAFVPLLVWQIGKSESRICQRLDASLQVQRDILRTLDALDKKASRLVDLVMEHRPPHLR